MSKYLVVGDLQLEEKTLPKATKLFNLIESYGLPVILLGDVLERRGLIEAVCLNFLHSRFANTELEFIINVGNHDLLNLHTEEHALEPLKRLKNVQIVDKPVIIDDNLGFIPYGQFKPLKCNTLILHHDIKGFYYESGIQNTEGLDPAVLKPYKLVVSGHYHDNQVQDNIHYLGSPYTHSFGEKPKKYIAILDTETSSLEYISTEDYFPMHQTLQVNCTDDMTRDDYIDLVENIMDDKDYNRIILNGLQHEVDRFPKDAFPKYKIIEKPITPKSVSKFKETMSPEENFKLWAKEVAELDELTIELGQKVLRNV